MVGLGLTTGELQAVEIFKPGRVTVSLSVDEDLPACTWVKHLLTPQGYSVQGSMVQRFGCGGCVVHYNLLHNDKDSGALARFPAALPQSLMPSCSAPWQVCLLSFFLAPCDSLG